MVAEPQQAAATNAVLLGALREEEKETKTRKQQKLCKFVHQGTLVPMREVHSRREDTRWTGRTTFDRETCC